MRDLLQVDRAARRRRRPGPCRAPADPADGVARRLIAATAFANAVIGGVDEDAEGADAGAHASRRAAWCSCSVSAAATSSRAIRNSSRSPPAPRSPRCVGMGFGARDARPPPAGQRAPRPRRRRVRRHPRARRSPAPFLAASGSAAGGPSGPGPRIASTPTGEGSAGAGHRARGRVVADRRGRCMVRIPGSDACPVRDALRRGRAVGLGTAQPAAACGSRPAGAAPPGSSVEPCFARATVAQCPLRAALIP